MSELDNCIKKGLIKEAPPSKENAFRSMARSEKWLSDAKKAASSGLFDSCLVASYVSMFHSSRSVLTRDGFRERSHYCIARYLEERYAKERKLEIKVIDILDRYRELRHEDVYGIDLLVTEEEAKESIKNAEYVFKEIEHLLK